MQKINNKTFLRDFEREVKLNLDSDDDRNRTNINNDKVFIYQIISYIIAENEN